MFLLCSGPSPFTEGAFRRRSVAERGWRRLQARLAPSSQEARSPSGPDEGSAFGGWTRSDEGQRQCCLDHASGEKPSGPIKKYGDRVKNRRGGAPGGALAGHTAGGRLPKRCPLIPAPFRRSASLGRQRRPGRESREAETR